ncbi:hypothetical protein J5J10_07290 [Ciceribacter sp. L1K23]|uniref:hypothetical protein n=1 Tax=Ciceribacter sp. L1K23 TaxID=2820276 RepID=UPI001B815C8F|nr:hypothetical protein [Ciceribacter sp. L1K23]MBR0555482.1 hypothetical protein [Ciceribacter sp. L1K23]
MLFSSLCRRVLPLLVPVVPLAGCSPERFLPPAEIGSGTSPDRQLVGRVDGSRQLIGRVGDPGADTGDATESGAMAAADFPDAPMADQAAQPIVPPETASGAAMTQTWAEPAGSAVVADDATSGETSGETLAGGAYAIPADGVSMDAGLGIGAAPGTTLQETVVAPPPAVPIAPEDMVIAEGATEQPVVDGIGTDQPVYVVAPPAVAPAMPQDTLGEASTDITPDPTVTGGVSKPPSRTVD